MANTRTNANVAAITDFFYAQVIGKKGFSTAQSWAVETAAFLESIGFTAASTAVKAWIGRGASKSTTSGVAYQKQDNQGVFPPEQVYCNLRGRRPRNVVARAIAYALLKNVPYNPDRFSQSVSVDGLMQGLEQFTNLEQYTDRVTVYKELQNKKLSKKDAGVIATLTEATDQENRNDRLARMMALADRLAALDPNLSACVSDYAAKQNKPVQTEPAEPVQTEPAKAVQTEPDKTAKTGRRRLTAK